MKSVKVAAVESQLIDAELQLDKQKIGEKLKTENEEEILRMFAELKTELETVKSEKAQVWDPW